MGRSSPCPATNVLIIQFMTIPIVDIFAGPGGLGEGFSNLKDTNGERVFKIALSIEKNYWAHQTLEMRSFFRQFEEVPEAYYDYLRGRIARSTLFSMHPCEAKAAKREAVMAELGNSDHQTIISDSLQLAIPADGPWILIGGPPCQVYSVMGRSRMRGNGQAFLDDKRHLLYREYLNIIAGYSPDLFIMENVKGILSSKAGVRAGQSAMFQQVRNDLEHPGLSIEGQEGAGKELKYRLYSFVVPRHLGHRLRPQDFIVKCEEYGIPQSRHRVVILGIRDDIKTEPGTLSPVPKAPTVRQMINDLPKLRSALSRQEDSAKLWHETVVGIKQQELFLTIEESIRNHIEKYLPFIATNLNTGSEWIEGKADPEELKNWVQDSRLAGTCNHTARAHMRTDLYRYLFAACYSEVHNVSPQTQHFPPALLPDHINIASGDFDDRFRVQLAGRPSTTVTSHISKDGHYHIHYDPSQCRSLTVREAARLQTFPDNYFFEGSRTQQYQQVGNAVPPLLAFKMAEIVYKLFSDTESSAL